MGACSMKMRNTALQLYSFGVHVSERRVCAEESGERRPKGIRPIDIDSRCKNVNEGKEIN